MEAGPLTVNAEYNSTLATKDWYVDLGKPLRVTVTAVNKRKSGQKIYLTKATAHVTAFDEAGPVDGPHIIPDSANISPGFIVTFPNTYNQTFILPAVEGTATQLTIDLTFEFAQEVEKNKDGRDFAKQVSTDKIIVPLAG